MKRIWLVRHGQSKSQTGEEEDPLNPDLSDLGIRQARRLINPLKALNIDCILISPLKRAWQTYEISKIKSPRTQFDSRIIESDWSIPNYYEEVLPMATPDFAIPDHHSAWLKPVKRRAEQLLRDLLIHSDEENFLLFGHWGIFSEFLLAFVKGNRKCNLSTMYTAMDNAALSFLEVDDEEKRYVRYWNERSHVMDLLEG